MPLASRACSGPERGPRRPWLAACLLLWLLTLAAVPAWAGHAAIHQHRAWLLEQAGGDMEAPPAATVDPRTLGPAWREVALPFMAPRPLDIDPLSAGGTITRWFRVDLPAGLEGEEVLYLPRWQTIGRITIYADGRLVYHSRGGPVWNGFNLPLWLPLNITQDEPPPQQILVRLVSPVDAGAGLSSLWVGPRDELIWQHRLREALQANIPFMASAAFLAIGLFSLAVWSRRRSETAYLLFFVSSALFFLRCIHYYSGDRRPLMPEDWFGWITVNSLGWLLVSVYFFTFRLHPMRYVWLERGVLAIMGLTTLVTLPPLHWLAPVADLAPAAYLLQLVVMVVVTVVALWAARRSGNRAALVMAGWNVTNIPIGVHDWMLQNMLISVESLYLLPYTGMGLFVLFMSVVFQRYVGAVTEAEQARQQLQQRLLQREQELSLSYQKLRSAEQVQMLAQERQRLMQDMHDGLGSSLMSALHAVESGQMSEAEVAQVLRECIDDMKLAIDSLEPVQTDLLLLLATLRFRLAPRLQGSGLTLDWAVDDVPRLQWLEPRSALHILRIFQEVLTNIIKHARATRITVRTAHDDTHVTVTVEDNGVGFDMPAPVTDVTSPPRGKGLGNLLRRTAQLQGEARWERLPQGTRFSLRLPLQRQPG
ncbi:ATP-binding protein [Hydrogenophaga sp. R2]|uniref:sensor histidine kinase n=1 Tax=Hydrogenophaga sp. R2 TaxID=3132827 RepID=UPI003CE828D4